VAFVSDRLLRLSGGGVWLDQFRLKQHRLWRPCRGADGVGRFRWLRCSPEGKRLATGYHCDAPPGRGETGPACGATVMTREGMRALSV
jgi:hypothetical protein